MVMAWMWIVKTLILLVWLSGKGKKVREKGRSRNDNKFYVFYLDIFKINQVIKIRAIDKRKVNRLKFDFINLQFFI